MVNHNYFTQRDVERLEEQAVQIRQDIISMIHAAKAGHPGGSLSAVEMVTALYFHVLNIDPQNPRWADRDRFILSKGHPCPVLYAALARRGYFDPKELNTLRQYHSILQPLPRATMRGPILIPILQVPPGTCWLSAKSAARGCPSRRRWMIPSADSTCLTGWTRALCRRHGWRAAKRFSLSYAIDAFGSPPQSRIVL